MLLLIVGGLDYRCICQLYPRISVVNYPDAPTHVGAKFNHDVRDSAWNSGTDVSIDSTIVRGLVESNRSRHGIPAAVAAAKLCTNS